jgi:hypothetical protein
MGYSSHIYFAIRSGGGHGDDLRFEWGRSPYDGNVYSSTPIGSLPYNEWHMFTGTYDGSTVKTYKDGALVNTVANVTLNPSFGQVRFSNNSNGFEGSVDDARVYNRALSDAEVSALYNVYN